MTCVVNIIRLQEISPPANMKAELLSNMRQGHAQTADASTHKPSLSKRCDLSISEWSLDGLYFSNKCVTITEDTLCDSILWICIHSSHTHTNTFTHFKRMDRIENISGCTLCRISCHTRSEWCSEETLSYTSKLTVWVQKQQLVWKQVPHLASFQSLKQSTRYLCIDRRATVLPWVLRQTRLTLPTKSSSWWQLWKHKFRGE